MSNYSIFNNSSSQLWTSISSSSDGIYITGCYSNNIMAYNVNTNVWSTYTPTYSNVRNVSLSGSGQYQIALDSKYFYYSSNYGVSWIQVNLGFSTSTTGNYCVITANGVYAYLVTTIGYCTRVTLSSMMVLSEIPWPYVRSYNLVCTNSTGNIIVVLQIFSSNLYITNSGVNGTWYSFDFNINNFNPEFTGIYIGSNSNYALITPISNPNLQQGYIWYSNDITTLSGSNINPITNFWNQSDAPVAVWSSIAINSTGQYAIASINGGGIFMSLNYGKNWFQGNASTLNWINVTLSDSFNSFAIINSNQKFYYATMIFRTGPTNYYSQGIDLYNLFMPVQYGSTIPLLTNYSVTGLDLKYCFASLSSGTAISLNTNYKINNYNGLPGLTDLSQIFAANILFTGSGFTYTLVNGLFTITFASSGTITFVGSFNLNYTVVGGGSGGQVLQSSYMSQPSIQYIITIGSGSNTTVSGSNITTITAIAGSGTGNGVVIFSFNI